jgi:tripartite-type tricarboxylate transporter receptor subunit TctC
LPFYAILRSIPDKLGGVLAMFESYDVLSPFITAGKLRAIAVTSSRRISELPNVPTLVESGVTTPSMQSWLAILAPANTPKDVVNKINQIVVKTLSGADFQGSYLASTPDVSTRFISSEISKFQRLAKVHDIRVD